MRPDELDPEDEDTLNEGTLRSIVRSIFLRHRLRSKDAEEPEEEHQHDREESSR